MKRLVVAIVLASALITAYGQSSDEDEIQRLVKSAKDKRSEELTFAGFHMGMQIEDAMKLMNHYWGKPIYAITSWNNVKAILNEDGTVRIASDKAGQVRYVNFHADLLERIWEKSGVPKDNAPSSLVIGSLPGEQTPEIRILTTCDQYTSHKDYHEAKRIPKGKDAIVYLVHGNCLHDRIYRVAGTCYLLSGGDVIEKREFATKGTRPADWGAIEHHRRFSFPTKSLKSGNAYTAVIVVTDLLSRSSSTRSVEFVVQ